METMDKGGNFIGYLFFEGTNMSVALVDEGLAKMHFTAERGGHFKALSSAQEKMKNAKKNVSLIGVLIVVRLTSYLPTTNTAVRLSLTKL